MRAARIFVTDLKHHLVLDKVASLRIDLFGSLALTGIGHGTPDAILMGMEGESPETVVTSTIQARIRAIGGRCALTLDSTRRIAFDPAKDMVYHYFESLPQHLNGMRFCVFDEKGDLLATKEYFSIGGGFVVNDRTQLAYGDNAYYMEDTSKTAPATPEVETILVAAERLAVEIVGSGNEPCIKSSIEKVNAAKAAVLAAATTRTKVILQTRKNQDLAATAALPFKNAMELMELCRREDMTIAQVVYEKELRWRSAADIREKTLRISETMDNAIKNGCLSTEDMLPDILNVRRRAPGLYKKLLKGLYATTPLYKIVLEV
ncbi:hypothetical protein BGZ81_000370 [Podila clonocystis]|nr:hypothetical protein BGZ81_000370 [Podila clonocystis]